MVVLDVELEIMREVDLFVEAVAFVVVILVVVVVTVEVVVLVVVVSSSIMFIESPHSSNFLLNSHSRKNLRKSSSFLIQLRTDFVSIIFNAPSRPLDLSG